MGAHRAVHGKLAHRKADTRHMSRLGSPTGTRRTTRLVGACGGGDWGAGVGMEASDRIRSGRHGADMARAGTSPQPWSPSWMHARYASRRVPLHVKRGIPCLLTAGFPDLRWIAGEQVNKFAFASAAHVSPHSGAYHRSLQSSGEGTEVDSL
ncbi:hypothetical protein BS50DRAFT_315719 [Corynespora cassiicola Philippines]|uniref:Uncharacterized protein n=1 Tax=Corynespora cassiicola Philippines TaxID=1448308 RepID=A0A2T2NYM5_CORCC|nr:hypothetical protein BS50DRAFT_315719 [Corynespora cassiicola Philippines]